jgi:hypothetical protein
MKTILKRVLNNYLSRRYQTNLDALLSAAQVPKRKFELAKNLTLDIHPPQKILIGTHHKTGTAWMMNIFRKVAYFHSLAYYQGKQDQLPAEFDIFLQDHSYFDFDTLPGPYRGVHLIRDPRDVIISGCFYHQKSEEYWLHLSRQDLGGMTYQEKINSYDNREDQILFEMEHAGRRTIQEMLAWDYHQAQFFEVKYEELIADDNLSLFHDMFTFLGFPGESIPGLLEIAYHNSLFSGNLDKSLHIRSGKSKQWEAFFSQKHKNRFLAMFDHALIDLGYESDHSWAE